MALSSGALPSIGRTVFMHPQMGDDLSGLEGCTIVARFKPDYDYFKTRGFDVVEALGADIRADLVIVCLPRAKAAARDLLAQAAQHVTAQGKIALDGQKTDGSGAVMQELQKLGAHIDEVISKAHGKLAIFSPPADLSAWRAQPVQLNEGFVTHAGVFSADGPDRASELLAAALPPRLGPRVADFGAGWGYLSRAILLRTGVQHLDVIEADLTALDCARLNINDARAAFHWADVAAFRPARLWDAVVMNPPFHTSRSPDAGLGLAFIKAAHKGLAPNGQLWLVANRQLPYADMVQGLFKDVEELGQDPSFRVIRAAIPLRAR